MYLYIKNQLIIISSIVYPQKKNNSAPIYKYRVYVFVIHIYLHSCKKKINSFYVVRFQNGWRECFLFILQSSRRSLLLLHLMIQPVRRENISSLFTSAKRRVATYAFLRNWTAQRTSRIESASSRDFCRLFATFQRHS